MSHNYNFDIVDNVLKDIEYGQLVDQAVLSSSGSSTSSLHALSVSTYSSSNSSPSSASYNYSNNNNQVSSYNMDNYKPTPPIPQPAPYAPSNNQRVNHNGYKSINYPPQQRQINSGLEITPFQVENSGKLQLKDVVFISKDCTYRLGQYVVKEHWGREYSLLYKYVDYIFRCQTFSKQAIKVRAAQSIDKVAQFLIFHSGLQRRSDNQFLYVLLVPNSISKKQKWRVQFGGIHNSFMSKNELFRKLKEAGIRISDHSLPKRTKFSMDLSELLYNDTYSIQVNWADRLVTNKDRIYKVMGNAAFIDNNINQIKIAELSTAFDQALNKTRLMAQMNSRIAVPQGFVDTRHGKYRMELLLPLSVRYPKVNGKFYQFALAIAKSDRFINQYMVKSILTLEMAYANARLVGYVDSLWLCQINKKPNGCNDINEFCINP